MQLIAFAFALASFDLVLSRKFGECELAQELFENQMIPIFEIPTHLCIVNNHHDTAFNEENFFGLYKIGKRWWCGEHASSGGCNIKCDYLRDDDITNDVRCANIILAQMGVKAWGTSPGSCKRFYETTLKCLKSQIVETIQKKYPTSMQSEN
jgi:C-type lysozyme/alpha-lactalbumin family